MARGKAALRAQWRPRQLGSESSRLRIPQGDSQAPFFPSAHRHQTVSGGPDPAQSLWPRPGPLAGSRGLCGHQKAGLCCPGRGGPTAGSLSPPCRSGPTGPQGPSGHHLQGLVGFAKATGPGQVWVRQVSEHGGQGGSVPENCGWGRPAAGEGWDRSAQENWPLQTKGHGHVGCPAGPGPSSQHRPPVRGTAAQGEGPAQAVLGGAWAQTQTKPREPASRPRPAKCENTTAGACIRRAGAPGGCRGLSSKIGGPVSPCRAITRPVTGLPLDPQLCETLARPLRAMRGKASLGSTGCRRGGGLQRSLPSSM